MKHAILILSCFVLLSFKSDTKATQEKPADIVGTYLTADDDAKIRIFLAKNGKYSGKIVWLLHPNNEDGTPKLDVENPNKSKRTRKKMGLVILKNFAYDKDDNDWSGGTIYDAKSGKTYSGYMWFKKGSNQKTMNLKGYVMGMTWLGRTSTWTRVARVD
jgi:uncharacterized protein (DUF2147 family)